MLIRPKWPTGGGFAAKYMGRGSRARISRRDAGRSGAPTTRAPTTRTPTTRDRRPPGSAGGPPSPAGRARAHASDCGDPGSPPPGDPDPSPAPLAARRRPPRRHRTPTHPAGNSNTTRAPRTDGATASRPPWSAAIAAAIARPRPRRPRPPRPRLPARTNSATGAGNPGPRSLTSTRARIRSQLPRTSTTPPPCSIAFAIRLPVTCASRSRSPHTVRASPDHEVRSETPCAAAIGRQASTLSDTNCERSIASGGRDQPRRVRTASRSSSTSAARPSSRSIARKRSGVSKPLPAPPSSPSLTAVSGPRSSWHARATDSMRPASARRATAAATTPALAANQPPSSSAIMTRCSRRPAGSRRPTR